MHECTAHDCDEVKFSSFM